MPSYLYWIYAAALVLWFVNFIKLINSVNNKQVSYHVVFAIAGILPSAHLLDLTLQV